MTDVRYDPQKVEAEVQGYWDENQIFQADIDSKREKFYCLAMFPYPSGKLHVGHVRNYTLSDVIARYQRMHNKNVLHPIGWDAFGLPAEGAAVKHGVPPAKWTYENIEYMKIQLKRLGLGFDWSREMTTCKKEYYRWEQLFFTQLYEKGIVYKKLAKVNWCPHDQTVLANEQVENGQCWRCGTPVEVKLLSQWFLKITKYAQELLDDLEHLPEWPEQVKTMQRNWIGRSEGVEIDFEVVHGNIDSKTVIEVYTTRPDTLMGVTYLAISPEHPLLKNVRADHPELCAFITACQGEKRIESDWANIPKEGVDTGISVKHPVSGELLPVWAANFVLMEYGTGAVMSVPAHDQRDFEFAQVYKMPIRSVIRGECAAYDESCAFVEKGILQNSGLFDGLTSDAAFQAIADWLEKHGKGRRRVQYRLRDWGVSRQRYWGTPIPVCYMEDGSVQMIEAEDIPVVLPENVSLDGVVSPLKSDETWKQTVYKGQKAVRETDTFDTFMESSWYYARFCCPHENSGIFDRAAVDYWLSVDQYVGGIEHAYMHLLYARFFHKVMRDMGLVKGQEPFKRLLCQGMVLANSFYYADEAGTKHWVSPTDVEQYSHGKNVEYRCRKSGKMLVFAGVNKMSKSKNNGIDPQDLIDRFGADTLRFYILFAAPPEQTLEWSASGVEGAHRFLHRLWNRVHEHLNHDVVLGSFDKPVTSQQEALYHKLHATIDKVSDDYSRRQSFNTAIAAVMELFNQLSKYVGSSSEDKALERICFKVIVQLLSPVTPHICHILWKKLGEEKDILDTGWPKINRDALHVKKRTLIVQVNGKLRARIEVDCEEDADRVKIQAQEHPSVVKHTAGKSIRKIVFVPNKLINIVCD